MLITEHKTDLFGKVKKYQCRLLEQLDSELTLIYQLPTETVLEQKVLPKGTLSIGHFWWQRNYNCYHFINDCGETIAAYFNICEPPRLDSENIYWRDLTVDILKVPDENPIVLDEEELPKDLDSSLREFILQCRDRVLEDIEPIMAEVEGYAIRELSRIKAFCPDS